MTNQVVALNQKNVSVKVLVLDNATALPYDGLTAATTGHVIWYQRGFDIAAITDGGSAADMSDIGNAHVDWEFVLLYSGVYRVAIPDAAFIEGVGSVDCGMKATGYTCIVETVDIDPWFRFQGSPDSVTSTTTTFESGTTPLIGDKIMITEGTGVIGNEVVITSVSGEVATHAAFETGISSTTTTVLLISGNAITAQGGINADAASSTLATPAQVATAADQAIVDAQLATAAAATDIQSRLPAALSAGGNIPSDVQEINATAVVGTGIDSDKWRA